MSVTRWIFECGLYYEYIFERNPDRNGGDSFWQADMRYSEIDILGSALPTVHLNGFKGARRTLKFTAITGNMMRTLQDFYRRSQMIRNCMDHTGSPDFFTPGLITSYGDHYFSCVIISFLPTYHPTYGSFPGTGEDTWDLEFTIIKVS